MRGALAVALVLGALVAACSPNDPPGGEGRLSIATGGSGGVYQVYGGGARRAADRRAARLADDGRDDVGVGRQPAAGRRRRLRHRVHARRHRDRRRRGPGGASSEPLPLRALGTLYPNITQVVVKADSGIEPIEDLKGKTVSVGSPNSGTEVIALRLLEVAGLDPDEDVDASAGWAWGSPVQALRDGLDRRVLLVRRRADRRDHRPRDDRRHPRCSPLDHYLRRSCASATARPTQRGRGRGGRVRGRRGRAKTIGVPNLLMVREDMDDDARLRHHQAAVRRQGAAGRRCTRRPRSSTRRGRAEVVDAGASCTRARSATTRRQGG